MTGAPTGWFVARQDGRVYVVDRNVERLCSCSGRGCRLAWGSHGAGAKLLARVLLSRHLRRVPSSDLAEAFADDVLAYLPPEGWVLSPAWLDSWLCRVGQPTTDHTA